MTKKIVVYCLLVSLVFIMTPLVSAMRSIEGQSPVVNINYEQQSVALDEKQGASIRNGYLLLLVFVYTPGQGVSPYAGANITARSLLHRYNGTTDSSGVCVIKVRAPLLREKVFFIKVSVVSEDGHARSRIAFMSMKAWHIAYRIFLFANL
jgi:hypothetical protein